MSWLAENWIWVFFGMTFVAVHMFGHGGHGGPKKEPTEPAEGSRPTAPAATTDSHQH